MASKSPEQVRRMICRSRKPLVFRGLIDSWPMLKYSQSDYDNLFREKLLEFRVGNRGYRNGQPQWEGKCDEIKCTYPQLVKWSNNCDDGENLELSDLEESKHFLYYGYKYMKDIFEPDVLRKTDWTAFGYPERNGNDSTFWLGTAGAYTPCHYDTYGCNLVAQLSGRKRWILYPPEDTKFLKPTRVPYEESSVYSMINFENWIDTVPDIEGTHPHVVELCPGEVLFVPRHWWHYVRNEELSVSINSWIEMEHDRAEDHKARLHESLVKFLVAHTSRNLSPNVVSELLNPNEEDAAYSDLEEIQGFICHSLKAVKEGEDQVGNAPEEIKNTMSDLDESWIIHVVCTQLPGPSSEPEIKRTRSTDTSHEVDVLDVIRAFSHPRVIEAVSKVLQEL